MEAVNTTPTKVARHLLDETAAAMRSNDFERYNKCFSFPLVIAMPGAAVRMHSASEHRAFFDALSAGYVRNQVNGLERHIEVAVFEGPDIVRCAYVSRQLRDGTPVAPPYLSHARAERKNGVWKVKESIFSSDSAMLPTAQIAQAQSRNIPPADPQLTPEAIVMACLNRLSQAHLDGRIDLVRDGLHLPILMTSLEGTKVLADEDALRRDVETRIEQFRMVGITDWVRVLKSVTQLDAGCLYAVFRNYLLRNSELAMPGLESAAVFKRQDDDGTWRMDTLMHHLGDITLERLQRDSGMAADHVDPEAEAG